MKVLVSAIALLAFVGAATVPVAAQAASHSANSVHKKAAHKSMHKAHHKVGHKKPVKAQG